MPAMNISMVSARRKCERLKQDRHGCLDRTNKRPQACPPEVVDAPRQRLHAEAAAVKQQHAIHVVLAVLEVATELVFSMAAAPVRQRQRNLCMQDLSWWTTDSDQLDRLCLISLLRSGHCGDSKSFLHLRGPHLTACDGHAALALPCRRRRLEVVSHVAHICRLFPQCLAQNQRVINAWLWQDWTFRAHGWRALQRADAPQQRRAVSACRRWTQVIVLLLQQRSGAKCIRVHSHAAAAKHWSLTHQSGQPACFKDLHDVIQSHTITFVTSALLALLVYVVVPARVLPRYIAVHRRGASASRCMLRTTYVAPCAPQIRPLKNSSFPDLSAWSCSFSTCADVSERVLVARDVAPLRQVRLPEAQLLLQLVDHLLELLLICAAPCQQPSGL